MLTQEEFKTRVNYNRNIVAEAITQGHNLNWVIDKIFTYDTVPGGESVISLMRKIDDIYPALMLDHLPVIISKVGADAVRFCEDANEFVHIEYKSTLINSNNIGVGINGGLHLKTVNYTGKPTGITSAISAIYQIHTNDNVETKARETYFIVSDSSKTDWELVDILKIEADQIVPFLITSNKKQRRISLAKFLNYGSSVPTNEFFQVERWNNFAHRIRSS